MRHALILALILGLAACGLTAPASGPKSGPEAGSTAILAPGGTAMTGIATGQIEVTPLDAPASTAPTPVTPPASPVPPTKATATQAKPAAPAAGPAAPDTIPVHKADATTPHPKARPTSKGTADSAPPPPKSQAEVVCETAGGIWGQASDSGAYLCQKRTGDGGKICHAKGDCQGECLALFTTCAPVKPLLGCNDVLDSEGRQVTLCLN